MGLGLVVLIEWVAIITTWAWLGWIGLGMFAAVVLVGLWLAWLIRDGLR